jgi:hypothetical protein
LRDFNRKGCSTKIRGSKGRRRKTKGFKKGGGDKGEGLKEAGQDRRF